MANDPKKNEKAAESKDAKGGAKVDLSKFSRNAEAKVIKCSTCAAREPKTEAEKFQEERYSNNKEHQGRGWRVHNPSLKGYRCTCCQSLVNPS